MFNKLNRKKKRKHVKGTTASSTNLKGRWSPYAREVRSRSQRRPQGGSSNANCEEFPE